MSKKLDRTFLINPSQTQEAPLVPQNSEAPSFLDKQKSKMVDAWVDEIIEICNHPDSIAAIKALPRLEEKERVLSVVRTEALADTRNIIESWFDVNDCNLPNLKVLEETICETAICEWGIGTEVIFESNKKVIIKKEEIFIEINKST